VIATAPGWIEPMPLRYVLAGTVTGAIGPADSVNGTL
jgi:hypothetical protein